MMLSTFRREAFRLPQMPMGRVTSGTNTGGSATAIFQASSLLTDI